VLRSGVLSFISAKQSSAGNGPDSHTTPDGLPVHTQPHAKFDLGTHVWAFFPDMTSTAGCDTSAAACVASGSLPDDGSSAPAKVASESTLADEADNGRQCKRRRLQPTTVASAAASPLSGGDGRIGGGGSGGEAGLASSGSHASEGASVREFASQINSHNAGIIDTLTRMLCHIALNPGVVNWYGHLRWSGGGNNGASQIASSSRGHGYGGGVKHSPNQQALSRLLRKCYSTVARSFPSATISATWPPPDGRAVVHARLPEIVLFLCELALQVCRFLVCWRVVGGEALVT
jgi:hypothetical protein